MIGNLIQYVTDNYEGICLVAGGVIGLITAVVQLTPTPEDNKTWAKIYGFLERLSVIDGNGRFSIPFIQGRRKDAVDSENFHGGTMGALLLALGLGFVVSGCAWAKANLNPSVKFGGEAIMEIHLPVPPVLNLDVQLVPLPTPAPEPPATPPVPPADSVQ